MGMRRGYSLHVTVACMLAAVFLTGCDPKLLHELSRELDRYEVRLRDPVLPTPVVTPTPTPIVVAEAPPVPREPRGDGGTTPPTGTYKCLAFRPARDGHKIGFIFLQSHTKKVAKVIFPGEYQAAFARVVLLHKRKGDAEHSVIERYRYDGMHNPDRGQLRQHWIGSKPTSRLPSNAIVYADGNCWKLGEMSERID